MAVESVRVHMLSSRHVVILKQMDRDRYLPIWIGPWEASSIAMKLQGLTPERPLTHDLFATTLEELGAVIGRVVISELAEETFHATIIVRARRPDDRGGRPSVRRAGARRPGRGPDLRVGGGPRPGGPRGRRRSGATRAAEGSPLESTGEGVVDPRLDMFRDFVNSLEADPRRAARASGRARRRRPRCRPDAARSSPEDRAAAAQRARVLAHIRSRRRQKSRTARKTTWRLRAGRRAGRSRVVRDADLDHPPAGRLELDQQLGREERAARFDAQALERRSRRKSLQAQSTSVTRRPKKIRLASR